MADDRNLNEEGESRNKWRYAVIVQDLATQWIQSYPRKKTNTSQETTGSPQKFFDANASLEVSCTDDPEELGEVCEESLESLHVCATSIRDERHRRQMGAHGKRRYIRDTPAIWSG